VCPYEYAKWDILSGFRDKKDLPGGFDHYKLFCFTIDLSTKHGHAFAPDNQFKLCKSQKDEEHGRS
jgi:hypothetical protein